MKIQAINNYCILKMIKNPTETMRDGIFLPNSAEKSPRWGEIVSTGPGVVDLNAHLIEPDVKVGEKAYVTVHGQHEVYNSQDGEFEYTAASILDILAVHRDEMNIQPLGSYIEIEKIEEDVSEDSILLPDIKKFPTNIGIVKTLGVGWKAADGSSIPFQVKVGDKIIYHPLRTMIVDLSQLGHSKECILIMHSDILGIVNDEK